jgi:hypothetical protein
MKTPGRARLFFAVLVASLLGSLASGSVAQADSEPKVTICHFPPGNPGNVQVITVGASAVPAHVANHDDAVCAAGASSCCFGGSSPSTCTNFASDNNNCGACGHVCGAGTTCTAGACVSICAPGTTFCGCACVNTGTDNDNCGACGNVCAPGTACSGGSCVSVCGPGTAFCGSQCLNTACDDNNCGACGNKCPAGTTCSGGTCIPICGPGETLCGTTCVDTHDSDPNNCGACGHVCATGDTCVSGVCTPPEVVQSCLPASSLSVLIQGSNVTAYVPLASWSEATTGVHVVPLEPAAVPTTVATTGPVNSCSSNNFTGTTVCTGNSNDVYVINGTTLSSTATAGATGRQGFSGGNCFTCGVAFEVDPVPPHIAKAWIAEGVAPDLVSGGALQSFDPTGPTFATPIGLFGLNTSEDVSIDPGRKLILSANESNVWQIVNTGSGIVYNSTPFVPPPPPPFTPAGELDSTAEDCLTGVALAPFEFTQAIAFVNLQGATFTGGTPGVAPGTWTSPSFVQDFTPDFANLQFGTNGAAVAPGSHLAVVTGEFGSAGIGVLQLPTTIAPAATPSAVDWVSANVPNDPSATPWAMGRDPHTVTAYVSPNGGKAYAVISNQARTFLVKVDMAMLLAAPRLPGTHTADSTTAAYAASFTFVAQ